MPRINTPSGPIDFPDGMSDTDISAVLAKEFPAPLSKGVQANGMLPGGEPTLDPVTAGPWTTAQVSQDGVERHMVLPTQPGDKPPSGDGLELGDAVKRYLKTGQHYGAFDSDALAKAHMDEQGAKKLTPKQMVEKSLNSSPLTGQRAPLSAIPEIAAGAAVGVPGGMAGAPGDVESLLRIPLSYAGASRENQFFPTSDTMNKVIGNMVGLPDTYYTRGGASLTNMFGLGLDTNLIGRALAPAVNTASRLREGMNPDIAGPRLAAQALRETATGPIDFEQSPLPGMDLSTGQLSNNQGILFGERAAERTDPNVMNVARNQAATNNQAITEAINGLGNPEAANASATMGERVRAVRDQVRAATRQAWANAGVDENTTLIPTTDLKESVNGYIASLPKADRAAVPSSIQDVLGQFGDAEPIREIQSLRSHVGGLARAAKDNPNTSRILRGIEDHIENFTDDALMNERTTPTLPDVPKPTGGPPINLAGDGGAPQTLFQRIRQAGGIRTMTGGEVTKEGQDVNAALQDQKTRGIVNNISGQRPDVLHGILHREGWFGGQGDGNIQDLYDALQNGKDFQHPEAARAASIAGDNARALEDARDLAKQYGIPVQDHWTPLDIHNAINATEAQAGRTSIDPGPYNAARDATRQMKERFTRPGLVRNILGTDRFGDAKIAPSEVASKVITSGPGAAEDLGHYLRAIGNDPQGMQAAKDAFAERFIRDVQGTQPDVNGLRQVMPAQVTKFVDKYQHVIDSPLYTDAERDTINRIQRASEMAARTERGVPRGGSDTASNLAGRDFLNAIVGNGGARVANLAPVGGAAVGGAIGGKLGAVLGAPVAGALTGAEIGRNAASSMFNVERLFGPSRDRALELLRQALKDPEVARRLLASVPGGARNVNAGRYAGLPFQGANIAAMAPAALARSLSPNSP